MPNSVGATMQPYSELRGDVVPDHLETRILEPLDDLARETQILEPPATQFPM